MKNISPALLFFFILVLSVIAFFMIFGPKGLIEMRQIIREKRKIERNVWRLRTENMELRKEIDRLKTDDRYLERVIREEYDYIRDGEVIFKLKGKRE
jgi:cell division protein FtsB